MALTWWRRLVSRRLSSLKPDRNSLWRRSRFPLPELERLEHRLAPAAHTWSGLSTTSSNWSDSANWTGGVPMAGEANVTLTFPTAPRQANTNDIANLNIQSITFTASGYNITGTQAITLQSGGISVAAAVSGSNTLGLNITLGAAASITTTTAAGATLVISGTLANGGFLLTAAGTGTTNFTNIISGSGGFTEMDPGMVGLSGVNTYAGTTTLNGGTLLVGVANALPTNGVVVMASGATLNVNNFSSTIGSLAGVGGSSVNLGSATLTTGGNGMATTFSGIISGTNGGLTKAGSSTFTLGGVNTYTGATTINTGILQVGIANALPSNTAVTVAAGATLDLNNLSATIGSLAGAGNVTLGSGTLTTGGNNTSTVFSGVISGTGGLTKSGTGTFTLSGLNTYTGATTVNGGTLQQGAASALPSMSDVTIGTSATLDLNGFGVSIGSLAGTDPTGSVTLGNATLVTGLNNNNTAFAGVISGSGGLVKTGTGTFTLSGANTYTGATAINGGILRLGAANTLPGGSAVSVASGATLDLNNNSTTISSLSGTGNITLGTATLNTGGSAASAFGGVISGAGALIKSGSGTLTLAGANAYAGTTTINAGTLQMGADNALPGASAVSVTAGATLDVNGRNLAIASLTGVGNVTLGSGTLTVGGTNASSTFSGVISGTGGLTKAGTGTLSLANVATYTGATAVNAGTLQMAANNALGNTAVTVAATAFLDLNSFSLTIGSLAGPTGSTVTLGSGTLTTGGNNTATTFSGVIAGSGGLTKVGTGTFTLGGGNTYTGATLVSVGTLLVNGPQPTSAVTVSSGATLGGTGRVGTVTTSGTVSPGVNGPGQLFTGDATHSGNVAFSTGSTLNVVLNGITLGTGYSQLNVTGTVTLSSSTTLTVSVGFPSSVGDTFMIVASTGAITGTFAGLSNNAIFSASGMAFRINYNSGPNNVTLTRVALPATTTTLSASATTTVFGQAITFTAVVMGPGGTPTGMVTFRDGTNTLGTQTLTGGSAMFTTTPGAPLSVGMHNITAVYSGDSSFSGSTSNTVMVTVNQAATSTALTGTPNPSAPGQNVTFTATVTATAPGMGTPTGMVTFRDGTTTLGTGTLTNGVATFSTTSLTLGQHTISAVYGGDTNFMGSTSPNFTQTVSSLTPTTTTLTSSATTTVFGQPVTFTATVAGAGGTPTGTVMFRDGTTTLGTGTLTNGVATFTTTTGSPLSVGTHSITAVYSGDTTFASSTSTALTQTVNQAATSTALTATPNPSAPGQNVTFTATVTATSPGMGTPTGMVTFRDGTTTLGTGTLTNGVATFSTTSLTLGQHTISAVYGADTNFLGSTSANLTQTVTNLTLTTTVVLSSANPSVVGQTVTFTVTVTPTPPATGTPTGSVTFSDGTTVLGTSPLDTRGVATFTTSTLSVGSHSITAVYSGDTMFATSTSVALLQTVGKANTTTTVSSSANPATVGQAVTFTATVSVTAPGVGAPSGTVTFMDGATTLGTGNLSGGQATFTTSSLTAGSHTITAVYSGDANFNTSTSSALTQTVNAATTGSNRKYVTQLYRDILARAPEQAGLDFWTGLLDQGTQNRSQVAFGIENSLEARTDQVQALYNKYLGRAADPRGLNASVLFLGTGGTMEQLQAVMISSPEYFQHAGGNNGAFVDAVFRDVLNRIPDGDARNASLQFLANGNQRRPEMTRRQLIDMVFTGNEYRQDVVQGFYQRFLGRAADSGGLNSFTTALQQGTRDEQVVQAIVSSDEYFSRAQSM